jgi:2-methylfumaryl-CoA hydratase
MPGATGVTTSGSRLAMTTPNLRAFDYGRLVADFATGAVYQHPFELTVDASIVGPYMASFLDATPMWTSDRFARAARLPQRPVPPHLLLNLGLSFSVHDVSQQAIAHLAYVRVAFPKPLPLGGTVRGATQVIAAKPAPHGERGTVTVHTVLTDDHGERVLDFERMALVRGGNLAARPQLAGGVATGDAGRPWMGREPSAHFADHLAQIDLTHAFRPPLFGTWEDLEPGLVLCHAAGRTVGESEHMQLSAICRNTHPLHWDEVYCQRASFKKTRVVYGGLVLAWTLTQASIDLGGHVLWEVGWSDGAHPAPVLAGDTIYAATQVLDRRPVNDHAGIVTLRHVGLKNVAAQALIASGKDIFASERGKADEAKVPEKVVEITRDLLVRRRKP